MQSVVDSLAAVSYPFELILKERSERETIRISFHPHELILSEEMKKNDQQILCRWCLKQVKDANYYCKECSFFVHESCAVHILRLPDHNWTSINEDQDGCYNCCWCEIVSDSPPSYVCRKCNVFLHKSCAWKLPYEIKHVFHRKHPLLLLPNCKRDDMYSVHDDSALYHCYCCNFTLDRKTALQQTLCLQEPESHKHQFIPFMRSDFSSPCDACGLKFEKSGSSVGSFLCIMCQIIAHEHCTSLPHTISIFHHNHPLTHTFFFLFKEEDMPLVDQLNCRICHTKVDKDFGGYYCACCHFATHVGCAIRNQISTNDRIVHGQDSIVDPFKEIELTEDDLPIVIKHFSHEHKLSRSDEIEDKCCDGCIRPISHPFYRCAECDFFLHKACIDLPNQITPAFHKHPLTLLPSTIDDINAIFRCSLCYNDCHGFVYSCEECKNFYVDVRCASIPLNFRHPGHDHILSFTRTNNSDKCDSCSSKNIYLFRCNECPFGIDYRCATLPSIARYWFHDHHLVLTYHTIDDGSDAYYCDVCEKERNPKHWYYYCTQCDYAALPDCALGKYPYLLPGRLYNESHPFFILQGSDFQHHVNLCSECHLLPLIPKTFSDRKLHKHPLVLSTHNSRIDGCGICQNIVRESVRFRCEKCDFDAHPKCVLRDTFTTQYREMTLSVVKRTNWGCLPCMVCDNDCRDACLKCPKLECSFCVHFGCARSLPMYWY
ncbi:uncharacterized protein LOC119986054 [Tripterygium wilfordii]|uniref:uncharacterized protein LOC119986054 n=1 Tax=Tripterygium wilfordii TaxID=458696 RepID=UPI0018F857B0|nr:uncharacterized protein LOC119986054 [Tripterygium wilfordii]